MRMQKPDERGAGKVVFGPARLCYTHLFAKYVPEGAGEEAAKYMCTVLIPKDEKDTIAALKRAYESAVRDSIPNKWKGKKPAKIDSPLKDGDLKDGEEFHGCWYVNAKAATKPQVCYRDYSPVTDEEEIYSGIYAMVSLTFYGYNVSGNTGVAAGLNNIMKIADGERLGGRVSAKSDFAAVDFAAIDRELNGNDGASDIDSGFDQDEDDGIPF